MRIMNAMKKIKLKCRLKRLQAETPNQKHDLKFKAKYNIIKIINILLLFLFASCKSAPSTLNQPHTQRTVLRGIIILVEFPDVRHNVNSFYVTNRFFKDLREYIEQMSYDQVTLKGNVTKKWYIMPNPISHYRIAPQNLNVDKSRVQKLIDDVLQAVNNDIDFSEYSFAAFFLGASRNEYGMVGLCGYPGILGWKTDAMLKTKSGQKVPGGIAIFTYQAHLGTLFHDVAHIIGGVKDGKRMVPCLYDHDLQATPGDPWKAMVSAIINMGFWDPMSSHFYKRQQPPPGISSWTKLRLGWINESKVRIVKSGESEEILIGPFEEVSSKTLVIRLPISDTIYYLIENRQAIGFDKNLPGHGILIMYVNDTINECRFGRAPVKLINAHPEVPHLMGAAFDLGANKSFHDTTHGIHIQLLEKRNRSYLIHVDFNSKGRTD